MDFKAVDVDKTAVVGSVEQTPALIDRQSHVAMVLQCQAIKHRLANMTMWLHACRAVTAAAVDHVAARAADAALWVSAAKVSVQTGAPRTVTPPLADVCAFSARLRGLNGSGWT